MMVCFLSDSRAFGFLWKVGSEKTNRMKQKKKKNQGTWFAFVAINNIWCLTRKSMERLWKDDRRKLEGKAGEHLPQNVQRGSMFTNVRIIQYGRPSSSNRIFSLRGLFYQLHSSQLTPLISYAFSRNHALLLLWTCSRDVREMNSWYLVLLECCF